MRDHPVASCAVSRTFLNIYVLLAKGENRFVAPGALLAIPAASAAAVKTTTTVGTKIKQALTDYGGYIVDGELAEGSPPASRP